MLIESTNVGAKSDVIEMIKGSNFKGINVWVCNWVQICLAPLLLSTLCINDSKFMSQTPMGNKLDNFSFLCMNDTSNFSLWMSFFVSRVFY